MTKMTYTEQFGKRLHELAEEHGFDINKFCSTRVPNQPQIRFSTATSWFGGHRFPSVPKLVLASKIISHLAEKKIALKDILKGVDVPLRTRVDLEAVTGEKW